MSTILITCILALCAARTFGLKLKSLSSYVEAAITWVLSVVCPIRNAQGHLIPGPQWRWPSGNILDKFTIGRQRSKEWETHGAIYRIWAGYTPEVVITTASDVQNFYTDAKVHEKAASSNGGWLFHQILGDCMGLINGTRWDRIHSQFLPTFMHRSVADLGAEVQKQALDYRETLLGGKASTAVHSGDLAKYPFFVTAWVIYGPMTEHERSTLWVIAQKALLLMRYVLKGGIYRYSICQYLDPAMKKELKIFERDWLEFNEDMYHSRSHRKIPSPIVSAWERTLVGEIPQKEVLHTLSEMLFANLDVTTHVLVSLLVLLGSSPQTQDEIRAELCNSNQDPQEYCGRKDTLLHYSYLESLRLRPFTAFSIPESSPSTKTLGGYIIPANTSVVIDTLRINTGGQFWGPNAREFRPERFKHMPKKELRYNLFTYGLGTRRCLGQYLAESMVEALVYHLLHDFSISLPSTESGKANMPTVEGSWVPISDVHLIIKSLQ